EGAAHALAEIAAAVELVEQAAARVRMAAQSNRATTARLLQQAQQVSGRATAHASGAEQATAAAEQQGASTQEMAAAAGSLLQAAEKLHGLVQGFRVYALTPQGPRVTLPGATRRPGNMASGLARVRRLGKAG